MITYTRCAADRPAAFESELRLPHWREICSGLCHLVRHELVRRFQAIAGQHEHNRFAATDHARGTQRDIPAIALEQPDLQLFFQLADVLAHRRLRDQQHVARARKAAIFSNRAKHFLLTKIDAHGIVLDRLSL